MVRPRSATTPILITLDYHTNSHVAFLHHLNVTGGIKGDTTPDTTYTTINTECEKIDINSVTSVDLAVLWSSPRYSEAFVDWLVKQYRANSAFFDQAKLKADVLKAAEKSPSRSGTINNVIQLGYGETPNNHTVFLATPH